MSKLVMFKINQFEMKKNVWYSPDVIKPKNGQKISFKPKDSDATYDGLYIKEEDMYYVGFADASEDFFYSWGIAFWKVLEETTEKKEVWLVNVNLEGQNLMFQFPTQKDQMKFVNEVKDRVDDIVYALDPCELVPMPETKPKKSNQLKSK